MYELAMLAVKGRYNGATVVLDSKPPIKECEVIVNFPDIAKTEPQPSAKREGSPLEPTQKNSLKQILKYRGQGIWEGDIKARNNNTKTV